MKKTVAIAFVIVLVATATMSTQPVKAAELSGTITMSGAWAIYPLAVKWGEAFKKLHPKVTMNISAGGAGKGMTDALSGSVDIGMVSREVDKAEKAKGAYPVFIAKDGVFPTVCAKNPAVKNILAKGITKAIFIDLYINAKSLTWKKVAGGPSAPVHTYTRSDACGAASAWAATLGKFKQDQLKGVGVYGDPGLLEAVRRDALGMGYNNLSYIFKGEKVTPGIKIIPIDANNNGKVDPSERIDTRAKAYTGISSGTYPGSRREFFVTNGKSKGLAAKFIEFALSDAGIKVMNEVGGYVPLSKAERNKEIKQIH